LDRILERLVDFTLSATLDRLSAPVVHAATCRYLDSVGCAAGAFSSEPFQIARKIAATATSSTGASVFGVTGKSTPEYATFANSVATRYLDYNDGYAGSAANGGVHPSDAAPAIVAAVEMMGGSGRDLLLGMHIAYEIAATIADEAPLRERGWDQGANISIAAAAAVGRIMKLDSVSLGHALAISMTPSMPMHVARTGALSHWKGCAGPQAAANAVWAVRLAAAGMTGPARPFEGVQGFFEAVAPITLEALGKPVGGLMGLQRVFTKAIPACGHSMAQVEAVMRLRDRIPPDAIAELDIGTYRVAWMAIGGGAGDAAEKWDPKSRETADHSLPYLVAIALFHGGVALDSFDEDKISDERLRPLMQRITVHVDDDMERLFVEDRVMASRISVQLKDGTRVEEIATTSRGKPDMPMSDEDFSLKFLDMAPMVMPPGPAEHLLARLWTLHDLSDISDLTRLFRQWSLQISSGSQGSCG